MNLQDKENQYGDLNDDILTDGIKVALEYEKATNEKPMAYTPEEEVDFASPVDKDSVTDDTTTNSSKSAYDDLDDYIYLKHTKHAKKRRKKKEKWKKILIIVLCVILAILIAFLGTGLYWYFSGKGSMLGDDDLNISVSDNVDADIQDGGNYIVAADGTKYVYNENITSILCMGVDELQEKGIVGENSAADALFLVTIDTVTGKTTVINISRDTMSDISIYSNQGAFIETRNDQIALAYAYGDGEETSCENQVTAVRNLFYNIPINSYASINLQGLETLNDYIGGVTVVSSETFSGSKWKDVYYFEKGKTYTLWGEQAHVYVRSRDHSNVEGNNSRMQRQMSYLNGFASKVIENAKNDISSIVDLYNVATPYICTNLNVNKVTYLAVNALQANYGRFETLSIPVEKIIEGEDEEAQLYIDEDAFFNDVFLKVFYTPIN